MKERLLIHFLLYFSLCFNCLNSEDLSSAIVYHRNVLENCPSHTVNCCWGVFTVQPLSSQRPLDFLVKAGGYDVLWLRQHLFPFPDDPFYFFVTRNRIYKNVKLSRNKMRKIVLKESNGSLWWPQLLCHWASFRLLPATCAGRCSGWRDPGGLESVIEEPSAHSSLEGQPPAQIQPLPLQDFSSVVLFQQEAGSGFGRETLLLSDSVRPLASVQYTGVEFRAVPTTALIRMPVTTWTRLWSRSS